MNLQHLRYFLTLAEYEHYTEAAEALDITQPTLSGAITSLERTVKVPLFEKKERNMILTKYGKTFSLQVEKIITDLDTSIDELEEIGAGTGGLIDLAFLQVLGTDFIPSIVKRFIDSNKPRKFRFHFHIGDNSTETLINGLKEGKYDLAICSKMESEANIDFIPVAKQEMVIITTRNHPLGQKRSVHLSETIPYPFIAFSQKVV